MHALVTRGRRIKAHPAPRVILREQLAQAAELGLELKVGAEVEYFLVERYCLYAADGKGNVRRGEAVHQADSL